MQNKGKEAFLRLYHRPGLLWQAEDTFFHEVLWDQLLFLEATMRQRVWPSSRDVMSDAVRQSMSSRRQR